MDPVLRSLAVLASGLVATFLVKAYRVRSRIIELRRQGLAMPPHSWFWGHLLVVNAAMSKLPSDARGNYIPRMVKENTPGLGPIFYLDLWPFGPQMLVVASPAGCTQMTVEHSLPKYHAMRKFLDPLTGGHDLVTMEGDMWKTWRSILNPCFSPNNLMGFVSAIVEDVKIFCDILRKHVEKEDIVPLKSLTDNLTMDVIGKVVIDSHLNSQQSKNTLATALRNIIPWLTFGAEINPLDRFSPIRPLSQWYYARQMNNYIARDLEIRIMDQKRMQKDDELGRKPLVDLVLKASLAERSSTDKNYSIDATFKAFIATQVKMFIFAGHDTTSSTICYIYHLLSLHPTILARVRAEHDSVIGTDLSRTASTITSNPHLLNQLPLTVAVIKETLRLQPPSSTTRGGEPAFSIKDPSCPVPYPTAGFMVWSNHETTHRDPAYWPDAHTFIPERWLVAPGDPIYPQKGAWRPFEHGPRNCIGQELMMVEVKIVLAMTLRNFTIQNAYPEWDKIRGLKGTRTVDGERAYTVGIGAPSEGLPCRIRQLER